MIKNVLRYPGGKSKVAKKNCLPHPAQHQGVPRTNGGRRIGFFSAKTNLPACEGVDKRLKLRPFVGTSIRNDRKER